jgi:PAS domain S-box-containing protein
MIESRRSSGIDIIGDVPWGTHFCQFYQTKEDLIDLLVPYFKAGLENNEFCMWVTSYPMGVKDAKEALRKAVPDIDVYMEKGQIEITPYNHWYVKEGVFDSDRVLNGWIEKLNQALANGYDGLRLTENTFWLEKKDWNDFVDYEEKIDRVLENYKMIALCTYSLDKCNATEIIDVVANHQFALIKREGKWEQIESSKRKQAEETLLRKEKELNEAQRIAHVGSWYWDAKTDDNIVSDELLRIFNQDCPPFQEQKGTMYPPESWERLNAAVQRAVQTGVGYELEIEALRGDGTKIWITTRSEAVRDTNGVVIGLRGTVQDITERKKTEEKLKHSEKQYRTLGDTIPYGIWLTDADGYCTYVSNSFLELVDMSMEQVQKFGWLHLLPPEDVQPTADHWLHCIQTCENFEREHRFRAKDGSYRNVLAIGRPIKNDEGIITGWVGLNLDITERKRAEEELLKAYEQIRTQSEDL